MKIEEKSQEQIIYENICAKIYISPYRECPLGSIGNIIHYLRVYGLNEYDTCTIGYDGTIGTVALYGETIAHFILDEEGLPKFEFNEKYKWIQRKQDIYLSGRTKWVNPYQKYM